MESENLTATTTTTTAPNHDETKTESTEFEKNQERYQELISTFPHEKGWRPKEPLIEYGGYWWLPSLLEGCIHAQEFFQARPNDFLVCSYPKTGTTWLKALTFAIANRSRFDDSSNPLLKRNPHEFVPYIEIDFPFFPEVDVLKDKGNTLFSTHIPYELLPDSVVKSGCKMVYIWREPKDTFISMWTFLHKERTELGPVNNLEESFDMFCRGLSGYGPYLDHVLAYWKAYQENPERILFLKYETMRADPLPYVKTLAEFMGHGFTAEEEEKGIVEKVVDLCSFETLKNLEANKGEKDREDRPGVYANSAYFRKGKVGDWTNYLTPCRVGFTDEFVAEMEPRFQAAFKAMEDLEKGSIANPDEGRMVGHYWLRNSMLAPKPTLKTLIENTLDSICTFSDDIISGKIKPPSAPEGRFTQILSVGIGGSALGPQFVAEALAPDNPPLKIRFIDNTDPAGIDHQIAQLGPELASTLVIVISKSGGTPETRNGLLEVQKAFREAGLNFSKQGVAITQENSLLDNTARIEGWLARFPMYDWVGGRTSIMSAVGLLPAALQGINVREMLAGAALMDEATRTTSIKNNPAALLAMCWYWASGGVGSKDMVILPYKDSLLLFSRYLQQLVMESLGKEFDLDGNTVNQGLTVYGNKGSTDQHAYIQQLREGVHNFFATFIEVLRDRPPGHDWELEPGVTCGDYLFGMLQGTRSALYANGRESISVTIEEVTPRSVGALIALYERAVGLYASIVNINAYHQPGVEAGKKAAAEVLALQKRVLSVLNEATCKDPVEPLTLDQIADRCHAPEEIEMIYKIIAHMSANDRVLIAEGNCGSPRSVKVYLGECNVDDLYA